MTKHYRHKRIFCNFFLILFFISIIQLISVYSLPVEINVIKGENKVLDILLPFTFDETESNNQIVKPVSYEKDNSSFKRSYSIDGIEIGNTEFQFKLLGLIPVKDVKVKVIERPYLIPGGNSIGVKLNTKGVLVVAVADIIGIDGKKYNPAKDAGIKAGDSIVKINGQKIRDAQHVVELLNDLKDTRIKVEIERNKANFTTEVKPVKSMQDNCYRLGIWVRDKTAGIGTLTFYDENTKVFGALGHGITDIDTGKLLSVENGKIMNAKISNVEQGKKGSPGEIRGIFYETEGTIGDINKNTSFGIYGDLYNNSLSKSKAYPIAFKEEVKEGKAYILSTIDGEKVEKFDIEIVKAYNQTVPEQKSMIIRVTDKKLLQKTGGIVQGMSGSPIIQNGKIVGAVTHVFVNDPSKGYGLYIEWMLRQIKNSYDNSEYLEIKR
ncbi:MULTISPECIES: SpoIVB peptidase [Tissierellales]|uniref:SpoIVB peptidase n=1 Tax=Acidilutibacter cellobiosedens TaxID=2507161 RepID=A0A410QCN5_9FIRM|nr:MULTISPECIES: SpoIVB peptidase [Tissierellales]MBE6082605.1 SpoIVB peptidase [Tissierellaceae bacterium]QAT61756.1 SpoIVB peptidase [Acidilutibacter cellobiosedens]SCL82377.1 SpoIVB peptidase precursor [Sporanaerobacter sp. PP17-6a]